MDYQALLSSFTFVLTRFPRQHQRTLPLFPTLLLYYYKYQEIKWFKGLLIRLQLIATNKAFEQDGVSNIYYYKRSLNVLNLREITLRILFISS